MIREEILPAVRKHYPTARAVRVDGARVWVDCDPEPDWSGWGRAMPGGVCELGTSPDTARLAAIARVWAEVERGVHDTTEGHRPSSVVVVDDCVVVHYPGKPGGIPWETKVRYV